MAITRCGNFYGGGDLNWNRVVPGTIRSVIRGERPVIRSDGQFVRDYFYVEDAAAACMLLAERVAADAALGGMAFNFSNEIQVTVLDLVHRILAEMGSALEPDIRQRSRQRDPLPVSQRRAGPAPLTMGPAVQPGRGLDEDDYLVLGVLHA